MKNIVILGAAGFIGTNLIIELAKESKNQITAVDKKKEFFNHIESFQFRNVKCIESSLTADTNFDELLEGQETVYHLLSTTVPATSNRAIPEEIKANVILSANLFESCVHKDVKKVVFLSSGGTVYGKESKCPLNEKTPTNPISSYGLQKVTIEKLLYLYNYMYGLDFRIIRLANPYGPYQRPNGLLGAVTTFTYKALKGEEIEVYGDGSVVRDFIYIDDAIKGILNIVNGNDQYHKYNLGCGYGISINQLLDAIQDSLGIELRVKYSPARNVDVPINYLDISRYINSFGQLNPIDLKSGIKKTAEFMKKYYSI